jgi:hypothetical protein
MPGFFGITLGYLKGSPQTQEMLPLTGESGWEYAVPGMAVPGGGEDANAGTCILGIA